MISASQTSQPPELRYKLVLFTSHPVYSICHSSLDRFRHQPYILTPKTSMLPGGMCLLCLLLTLTLLYSTLSSPFTSFEFH